MNILFLIFTFCYLGFFTLNLWISESQFVCDCPKENIVVYALCICCCFEYPFESLCKIHVGILKPFCRQVLVKFVSGHRKIYDMKHLSLRLVECKKGALENKKLVGASLVDFSISFHYTPHDLLLAKIMRTWKYLGQNKKCLCFHAKRQGRFFFYDVARVCELHCLYILQLRYWKYLTLV